jgi:hypothetical protein
VPPPRASLLQRILAHISGFIQFLLASLGLKQQQTPAAAT